MAQTFTGTYRGGLNFANNKEVSEEEKERIQQRLDKEQLNMITLIKS